MSYVLKNSVQPLDDFILKILIVLPDFVKDNHPLVVSLFTPVLLAGVLVVLGLCTHF